MVEISVGGPFRLADGLHAAISDGSSFAQVRKVFGGAPHFNCESSEGCTAIRNRAAGGDAIQMDFLSSLSPPYRLIGIAFDERARLRSSSHLGWWIGGGVVVGLLSVGTAFAVRRRRRAGTADVPSGRN